MAVGNNLLLHLISRLGTLTCGRRFLFPQGGCRASFLFLFFRLPFLFLFPLLYPSGTTSLDPCLFAGRIAEECAVAVSAPTALRCKCAVGYEIGVRFLARVPFGCCGVASLHVIAIYCYRVDTLLPSLLFISLSHGCVLFLFLVSHSLHCCSPLRLYLGRNGRPLIPIVGWST